MTNLNKIVEMLAQQALGNNSNETTQSQQNNSSNATGLGGILGSVLDQIGKSTQQNNQNSSSSGLGGILGTVLGQLGGTGQAKATTGSALNAKSLLIMVLPLVLAWIQKQGGIQGALDKLKGQGLNRQVDDWVSTESGTNATVEPQQVELLFDDQDVEQVAQEAQAPKQEVYQAISKVLPQIIDALTPQGESTNKQEANGDIQNVLNLVSGFLKK
jgi:uncharacterized protein YidB (DUF937 family)